ncbi:diguanylate cyclase (GGDEF) domain-containing protein [Marinospirillum celere]|uniref:Diguanylate cyclase (GGDEF) domain-containing protein n=1 Tax=Marinospirillum celere TaxID=1122252 RepID=A0A1I1G1F9_9GAMM|nr:GGDEF domain-containing protein [Marinospirillum celere]SFC03020.1 diguanylate cyclase (GGDEF) domain-containing protein [Marinospirillum celere]
MRQGFSRQQRRVTASLYLILSTVMALLASQVYLSAYYEAILLPALLTPIFFALGLLRWQVNSHLQYDPAALTALICLGGFLLLQPETLSGFTHWHFAGLFYPLVAFYLLPNAASLALSLLLLSGLLTFRLDRLGLEEQLLFCFQYLLLVILAWHYGLSSRLKTQKLELLTGEDAVTGLLNAEHLQSRLTAEVARSRATQRPLALLLIEFHQYPQVVEELGQASADRFLQEAGKIALQTCRTGDEAYRMDDLTLLLLLPNTTINGALVLRERLYHQLLHQVICELGPLDTTITPLLLQPGEKPEELWQRIGESCYHSLSERVDDQLEDHP